MEITELSIFQSLKMKELKSLHLEHNQSMPAANCRARGTSCAVGFCPLGLRRVSSVGFPTECWEGPLFFSK